MRSSSCRARSINDPRGCVVHGWRFLDPSIRRCDARTHDGQFRAVASSSRRLRKISRSAASTSRATRKVWALTDESAVSRSNLPMRDVISAAEVSSRYTAVSNDARFTAKLCGTDLGFGQALHKFFQPHTGVSNALKGIGLVDFNFVTCRHCSVATVIERHRFMPACDSRSSSSCCSRAR